MRLCEQNGLTEILRIGKIKNLALDFRETHLHTAGFFYYDQLANSDRNEILHILKSREMQM